VKLERHKEWKRKNTEEEEKETLKARNKQKKQTIF